MNQRSTLSTRNRYWIPRYRYLELKNFCLQYPDWKLALREISEIRSHSEIFTSGNISDPTYTIAMQKLKYQALIDLIEETAKEADDFLAKWIIKGVSEGYTYQYLNLRLDMPTSRDTYYNRYRKFFWLLDQKR